MIEGISACDDNDVGSCEILQRLAQPASRQQMVAHGVARGIDEDQVEVARQPPMLETVIQHDAVDRRAISNEVAQRGESIGAGNDWHVISIEASDDDIDDVMASVEEILDTLRVS